MERLSKAWIFVSHAVEDLEAVRRVRNELEARGAEPLLFFLKAVEEEHELRTLLRREIMARNFFLLCDSRAARESTWVQEEHEFVRSLTGKRIETLTLGTDWESQQALIDRFTRTATVFLSLAAKDRERVRPYAELLIKHDFTVWWDANVQPGAAWAHDMTTGLKQAAENGYLIAILSAASLGSQWVAQEIATFRQLDATGARLVLIDLEPIDHLQPAGVLPTPRYPFYANDFDTNAKHLLQALGLS